MPRSIDLEIEIISAYPEVLLSELPKIGVTLKNVRLVGDLTLRCSLSCKDYSELSAWCHGRNITIRILRNAGLRVLLANARKRVFLIAYSVCILFALWFIPSRILFVSVEGNNRIPAALILEKAANCGISFGVRTRAVRSENIKNALLQMLPELKWAGVNIRGCVATISVEESSIPAEDEKSSSRINSIIAAKDGVISNMTVLRGNPLCSVGTAVKAGQVLVSGYTDCGISIKATGADAEIYAQTQYELRAIKSHEYNVQHAISATKSKFSLIVGKKLINLSQDSGIYDTTCDKIYESYFITLPGGFQLPFGLIRETFVFYETLTSKPVSAVDHEACLHGFAEEYLISKMVSGHILRSERHLNMTQDACVLTCRFSCVELIGKIHSEEIIEYHGKTD